MTKKQRNKVREANPKPPKSKSTRLDQSQPAKFRWSTNEKQGDSILLNTVSRQVALATARQEMLEENSKF